MEIIEQILGFLTPAVVSLIIDLLVLLFVIVGFLWGLGRGLRKASIRGINVVLTAVFLVFVLPFIFDFLFTTTINFSIPGIEIQGKSLTEFLTGMVSEQVDPSIAANTLLAVQSLIIALITAAIFPIMYVILNVITWPIYAIIAACTKTKKEKEAIEQRKKGNKKAKAKKHALWGGLVGAVQAAFIMFIFLLPLGTLSYMVAKADDVLENEVVAGFVDEFAGDITETIGIGKEDIVNYLNVYGNSITGKVFGVGGMDKTVFGWATTKTSKDDAGNSVTINLVAETENIIDTINGLLSYLGENKIDIDMDAISEMDVDYIEGIFDYLVSTPQGEDAPVITNLIGDIINPVYGSGVMKAVLVDAVNWQRGNLIREGVVPAEGLGSIPVLRVNGVQWAADKEKVKNNLGTAFIEIYNVYTAAKDHMDILETISNVDMEDTQGLGELLGAMNGLIFNLSTGIDWLEVGEALDGILEISLLKDILRPSVRWGLEILPDMGFDLNAIGLENTKFATIFGSFGSSLKIVSTVSQIFSRDYSNMTFEELDAYLEEVTLELADIIFTSDVIQNIMMEAVKYLEDMILGDSPIQPLSAGTKTSRTTTMDNAKWEADRDAFAEALYIIGKEVAIGWGEINDPLAPTGSDIELMASPERLLELGRVFDLLYDLNIIRGIKYLILDEYVEILFGEEGLVGEGLKTIFGTGSDNILRLTKPSDYFKILASLSPLFEAGYDFANNGDEFEPELINTNLAALKKALLGETTPAVGEPGTPGYVPAVVHKGTIDVIFEMEYISVFMERFVTALAGEGIPGFVEGLELAGYETPETDVWTAAMAEDYKLIIGAFLDIATDSLTGIKADDPFEVFGNLLQDSETISSVRAIAAAMDGLMTNPLFDGFLTAALDKYVGELFNEFAGDFLDYSEIEWAELSFSEIAEVLVSTAKALQPIMGLIGSEGEFTKADFVASVNDIKEVFTQIPYSPFMGSIIISAINKQIDANGGTRIDGMVEADWEAFARDFNKAIDLLFDIATDGLLGDEDEFADEPFSLDTLIETLMSKIDFKGIDTDDLSTLTSIIDELIDLGGALDTLVGWNSEIEYTNPLESLVASLIAEQLKNFKDTLEGFIDVDAIKFGGEGGTTVKGLFETMKAGIDLMEDMGGIFDGALNLDPSSPNFLEDLGSSLGTLGDALGTLADNPVIIEALAPTIIDALDKTDIGTALGIQTDMDTEELVNIIVNEAGTVSKLLDVVSVSMNEETTEEELEAAVEALTDVLGEGGIVADLLAEMVGEDIEDLDKENILDFFKGLAGFGLPFAA